MRRDIVDAHLNGWGERVVYRMWAKGLKSPFMYGVIGKLQKWDLRRRARKTDGWVTNLPKMAAGWTQVRDMPAPAKKSFHQLWKKRPDGAGAAHAAPHGATK
jgi:L-lactate dehydrogenase complex protein LldF